MKFCLQLHLMIVLDELETELRNVMFCGVIALECLTGLNAKTCRDASMHMHKFFNYLPYTTYAYQSINSTCLREGLVNESLENSMLACLFHGSARELHPARRHVLSGYPSLFSICRSRAVGFRDWEFFCVILSHFCRFVRVFSFILLNWTLVNNLRRYVLPCVFPWLCFPSRICMSRISVYSRILARLPFVGWSVVLLPPSHCFFSMLGSYFVCFMSVFLLVYVVAARHLTDSYLASVVDMFCTRDSRGAVSLAVALSHYYCIAFRNQCTFAP